MKHNAFELHNARLKLDGDIKNKAWSYELEFDIAPLIIKSNDPENPALMNAYIMYNMLYIGDVKLFSVKAGYQKVPFSRCTLVEHYYSPFISRPVIAGGGFFSDRDAGVTLERGFWNGKLHIFAGSYTGLNDSLTTGGLNDRTGNLEYIGRAELSWPAKQKYHDLDLTGLPIPEFSIGAAGRYEHKATTTGADYDLITIDGKKYTTEIDASVKYMGFSAEFESDMIKAYPTPGSLTYTAELSNFNTNYFNAGGWYAQVNYHSKSSQIKSFIKMGGIYTE